MEPSAPSTSLSQKINADGFRRWHEYELTRSFGYLGLGVLSLVAALAIVEGFFDTPVAAKKIIKAILSFCALCLTAWSWQKFVHILLFAENVSKQAVCANCKRYGQLTVIHERLRPTKSTGVLTCRCKKCLSEWEMDVGLESGND